MKKQPKYVGAVIGAGFGDEGKGLTTDFLVRRHKPGTALVIRFNGSAQAGHTVTTDDGKHHVFQHFGSGTFAGANTYWSEYCPVHPIMFNIEYDVLKSKVEDLPALVVTNKCHIITPWDMVYNQALERRRQKVGAQHGSVGLGVGVAHHRFLQDCYITIGQAAHHSKARLFEALKSLRDDIWHLGFIGESLKMEDLTEEEQAVFKEDSAIERTIDEIRLMCDRIRLEYHGNTLFDYDVIVFEGAQGLMLSEMYGKTPYTTWSDPGLVNVAHLCDEFDIALHEVVFVSRLFGTRHGAGPCYLDDAPEEELELRLDDTTNVPHPWQGTMRQFALDFERMKGIVNIEFQTFKGYMIHDIGWDKEDVDLIEKTMMFTWGHLLKDKRLHFRGERQGHLSGGNHIEIFKEVNAKYCATGKTASTVQVRNEHPLSESQKELIDYVLSTSKKVA